MAKLSKTELMALDLMIQVMKEEQLGIEADVAAFIGGIVRVTKKIVNVTQKVTPVLRVTTQLTPIVNGPIKTTTTLRAAEEKLDPEVSVEALIAIREALSREQE